MVEKKEKIKINKKIIKLSPPRVSGALFLNEIMKIVMIYFFAHTILDIINVFFHNNMLILIVSIIVDIVLIFITFYYYSIFRSQVKIYLIKDMEIEYDSESITIHKYTFKFSDKKSWQTRIEKKYYSKVCFFKILTYSGEYVIECSEYDEWKIRELLECH